MFVLLLPGRMLSLSESATHYSLWLTGKTDAQTHVLSNRLCILGHCVQNTASEKCLGLKIMQVKY